MLPSTQIKNELTIIPEINPLVESIHDEAFLPEAYRLTEYVALEFDNLTPLSTIIQNAPEKLGYHIHPKSLVITTEGLAAHMKEEFYPVLRQCDDIGLYRYSEDPNQPPALKPNYREILTQPTVVPPDNSAAPQIIPQKQHFTLPIEKQIDSCSSSDASSIASDDNNNNNGSILILTILAFVAIQVIAYWARKNLSSEKQEQDDDKLHSAFESCVLYDTVFKLLLLLVPLSLLIIYDYHYYYYLRLKAWVI